jgi:hypothetical protein
MEDRKSRRHAAERGFALVLAILSLMLLTFLGLTLATTTSTELQIATNYRWSQQALYNAEAGLEAARIVLSDVADAASGWTTQLPAVRTGSWLPGSPGSNGRRHGSGLREVELRYQGGIGYGKVVTDGVTRYENVAVYPPSAASRSTVPSRSGSGVR